MPPGRHGALFGRLGQPERPPARPPSGGRAPWTGPCPRLAGPRAARSVPRPPRPRRSACAPAGARAQRSGGRTRPARAAIARAHAPPRPGPEPADGACSGPGARPLPPHAPGQPPAAAPCQGARRPVRRVRPVDLDARAGRRRAGAMVLIAPPARSWRGAYQVVGRPQGRRCRPGL